MMKTSSILIFCYLCYLFIESVIPLVAGTVGCICVTLEKIWIGSYNASAFHLPISACLGRSKWPPICNISVLLSYLIYMQHRIVMYLKLKKKRVLWQKSSLSSKLVKDNDALLSDMGHLYLMVFGILLCNHTPVKESCQQTNHTI